jgi:hypothetical protein
MKFSRKRRRIRLWRSLLRVRRGRCHSSIPSIYLPVFLRYCDAVRLATKRALHVYSVDHAVLYHWLESVE